MLIGQGKGRKAAQWGRLLHSPVGSGELPWSSGYEGDREEGIQLERDPHRVGKKSSGWHCNAIHNQEGSAQQQEMSAPQGVGSENHWPEVWDALQ